MAPRVRMQTSWIQTSDGNIYGDLFGWTLTVYRDIDPADPSKPWHWDASKFTNPDDPCDDRITSRAGDAVSLNEAKREAIARVHEEENQ